MNMPDTATVQQEQLEISLATATELCDLGLGCMVDIRQNFEIEFKGAIPGTIHIPLCEVKLLLGHVLNEDEQDTLDAGTPSDIDVQAFIRMVNQIHHVRDCILLCVCNSGRRSLVAARMLRSLGYARAYSVQGGFQAWKARKAQAQVQVETQQDQNRK
jgi:rhodanese-related sulfurtransferase